MLTRSVVRALAAAPHRKGESASLTARLSASRRFFPSQLETMAYMSSRGLTIRQRACVFFAVAVHIVS